LSAIWLSRHWRAIFRLRCSLSDRASARMSANTAIQLQFIQYCVVEMVEITEIVDINEYRVKEAIRNRVYVKQLANRKESLESSRVRS